MTFEELSGKLAKAIARKERFGGPQNTWMNIHFYDGDTRFASISDWRMVKGHYHVTLYRDSTAFHSTDDQKKLIMVEAALRGLL